MTFRKLFTSLPAVVHFLTLSCAQQEDPAQQKIAELMAQGKADLGTENFQGAIEKFQLVLDEYAPENSEALFGVAIASTCKTLAGMSDEFGSVFDLLFQTISGLTSGNPEKYLPQQSTSGVNAIVESIVDSAFLDIIDFVLPIMEKLKSDPNFSMVVEKLPVTIGVEPYLVFKMDVGGEMDYGEVYFLTVIYRFLKSAIYLLYSLNLSVSPETLSGLMQDFMPILTGEEALASDRDFIFGLLAYVLETSSNLLTLEPTLGAQRLTQVGEMWVQVIQDLIAFLDIIRNETDPQADDLIGYRAEGKKEYVEFHVKDKDGAPLAIAIEIPEDSTALAEKMISSMQADGGIRASWTHDMAPYLGLIFQAFLQIGLLDPVIALIVPMLGTCVGQDTVAMINNMMDLVKSLAAGGALTGGMTAVIPDVIELDWGYFFHHPPQQFLRLFLPAVVLNPLTGPDSLLVEYECTDLQPMDLWCQNPEAVSSTVHFTGTEWAILDDGVKNPLPYFSFRDASLDGLIYLNLYQMSPTLFPANEYRCPDSYEFNYFLGSVIGLLLGGLPSN